MPKKHLGQNFLSDTSILSSIISAADLSPEDTVVEIGAGPGRMTRLLAERAKRLIAIELDRALYAGMRACALDFIEKPQGERLLAWHVRRLLDSHESTRGTTRT